MEKRCSLCRKTFACLGSQGNCWCTNIPIDTIKLKEISYLGKDCFCEECLILLKNSVGVESGRELKIKTKEKGEFTLSLENKDANFLITIKNRKYRYHLLREEYGNYVEAIKIFFQYKNKLEHDDFKIIKNYEALDEHYRRVYQRVRYGILL